MPAKSKEQIKRETIEASLIDALDARKIDSAFYKNYVDEYMFCYDAQTRLKEGAKEADEAGSARNRTFLDLMAEYRRVNAQMMNMLQFLGLKPPEDKNGIFGGEDDEL